MLKMESENYVHQSNKNDAGKITKNLNGEYMYHMLLYLSRRNVKGNMMKLMYFEFGWDSHLTDERAH